MWGVIERRKSDRWGFMLRAKAAGWRSGGCGHLVGNLGNTASDIQSQFVFMNQKTHLWVRHGGTAIVDLRFTSPLLILVVLLRQHSREELMKATFSIIKEMWVGSKWITFARMLTPKVSSAKAGCPFPPSTIMSSSLAVRLCYPREGLCWPSVGHEGKDSEVGIFFLEQTTWIHSISG